MVESFWQSPEVQGGAIPFAVALILAIVLLLVGRGGLGVRIAVFGVAAGFLVAYVLLEGVGWPPVGSKQKIFYIVLGLILIGLVLDLLGISVLVSAVLGFFLMLGAIYWLAEGVISRGPDTWTWIQLGALAAASALTMGILGAIADNADGHYGEDGTVAINGWIQAPSLLLIAAFAAGAVSLWGAFVGMAQLHIALGAALGGFLLISFIGWVFAGASLKFGATGVLGAGGIWLTCIAAMILFSDSVDPWATAALLLVFVVGFLVQRVRLGSGLFGRLATPILFGAIALLPAAAAVAYVILTAEPDTGY